MTKETIHQARTVFDGGGDEHLLIEFDGTVSVLHVFNARRISGEDVKTWFYPSKEQWAELAVVAQRMAEEMPETKHPDEHWLNDRILAWQDLNRKIGVLKIASGLIDALRAKDDRLSYSWTVGGHPNNRGKEAVDLLVEMGLVTIKEGKHTPSSKFIHLAVEKPQAVSAMKAALAGVEAMND